MRVPLRWLREFVDVLLSADELAQQLSVSGTEVATVLRIGAGWERVVIARIEEIAPHPNADHLFVARARVQGDLLTLVTAAPNLKAGDIVPLVPPGGRLGPDEVVRERTFRGITSQGMLCSGDELGVSPDKDHIYVLEPEAPVGEELQSYLGDAVLDLEIKPNRPDCMGILGIAREVSALTGAPLRHPDPTPPRGSRPVADLVQVFVDDPGLCPRYTAAYLEEARVGPSPPWMQRRLHLCGMRPINNLVDVTNYVMLELGQPLHAFDADQIQENTIRVRRARAGEHLVTIDGVDREMPPETLLIADSTRPVGIAGVMGGLESEISEKTTRVVLESACFDALSIRRTARDLHLATEASKRFDKGLDPELPPIASYRTMALMAQLAGGQMADGIVDIQPAPRPARRIAFTADDVAGLIGMGYADAQIERVLGPLGFQLERQGPAFHALVPSWRADVEGKADIAEEIARIIGYDAIPTVLPAGRPPPPTEEPALRREETMRTALAAAGLQEVITYSLIEPNAVGKLDASAPYPEIPPDSDSIAVSNPMSIEHSRLRTTLLTSLLATVGANLRYQRRVAIFEIARVFLPPLQPLPTEARRLAIAMAGLRHPEGWASSSGTVDFYDLKGAVEAAFRSLRLPPPDLVPEQSPWLHPNRGAAIRLTSGTPVGLMGQVHPRVAERFEIERVEVYAAELDLEQLIGLARDEVAVQPLPRYPAVERDLAIIVDERIPHAEVVTVIREAGGSLLETATLFDVYQGSPIPSGKRSLAYSLSFRAADRTLAEEEVLAALEAIQREVVRRFNAAIRGAGAGEA